MLTFAREKSGTSKIIDFYHDLVKYSPELHTILDTRVTVHVFAVAHGRDRKGRLMKEHLLLNAYKVARSVGATAFTWIATSNNDKERARRIGLKVYILLINKLLTKSDLWLV